jgi:phage FluMu protein Com
MKECFYCHKPITTITDEFLGDVICPTCKVQNSFYPPQENTDEDNPAEENTDPA